MYWFGLVWYVLNYGVVYCRVLSFTEFLVAYCGVLQRTVLYAILLCCIELYLVCCSVV